MKSPFNMILIIQSLFLIVDVCSKSMYIQFDYCVGEVFNNLVCGEIDTRIQYEFHEHENIQGTNFSKIENHEYERSLNKSLYVSSLAAGTEVYKFYDKKISQSGGKGLDTILSYFTDGEKVHLNKWNDEDSLIKMMEESTIANFFYYIGFPDSGFIFDKQFMEFVTFDALFSSFEIVTIDVSFKLNTEPIKHYLKEIIRDVYWKMNEDERTQFQIISKSLCIAIVAASSFLLFNFMGFGWGGIVAGTTQ